MADNNIPEIDEIDSGDKLEAYLLHKPAEWSQKIAFRCAMRVFPIILQPTEWTKKNPRDFAQLTVSSWRVLSISALALKIPSAEKVDVSSGKRVAISAARVVISAAANANAANAARFSAYTAYEAATNAADATRAVVHTATNAANAVTFADNGQDVWLQIREDLHALNAGMDLSRAHLLLPLDDPAEDVNLYTENDLFAPVSAFEQSDTIKGTPYQIISDWYRAMVLSNQQRTPWGELGSEINQKIAKLGLDDEDKDFWDRDPDEVMADIAKIVDWPDYGRGEGDISEQLAPLLEGEPSKFGAQFVQDGDQYRIDQTASETDMAALEHPKVKQLYPRLQQQMEAFKSIANALNNQLGWQGISELTNRLASELSQGLEHVAENTSIIWLDIVELGSYWDQDKLARETNDREIEPLDLDRKRKLEHLITTASVFIRSFPTALELDEEARKFKQERAQLEAARAIVEVAKSIELMAKSDADLTMGAFEAEKRGGVQGEKAGIFGYFTSKNFVKDVVIGVVTTSVVNAGPIIYTKSTQFLREAEPAILKMLDDAPSTYSTAMRILIEQAKDEHNVPTPPSASPNVILTRRKEDDEDGNETSK